jgi:acetyl esterase/lipase
MERDFVELLATLPPFDLSDVRALRARLRAARAERDVPTPHGVTIRHVTVPGLAADPPIRVRLYSPAARRAPGAALVYCHGAGFVLGSLETDHQRCLRIAAEAGVLVASPEYRMAPEHPYPAGLNDCTAVLDWVAASAPAFGVDRQRIALGGTSSGATLATGVALRALDEARSPIALLLLVCPIADDRPTGLSIRTFWDCDGWNGSASTQMWKHYLPVDEGHRRYAVPNRVNSLRGLPPTHVTIADLDAQRDEGLALAERLEREGVATTVTCYAGVPHAFDALLPTSEISVRSISEQVRVLAKLAAVQRA